MPQGQSQHLLPYLLLGLLVVALLTWRLRRMSQVRPLRLEWLWVTPLIFVVLGVVVIIPQPPHGIALAYLAASLLVGGAFGWWRGKLMHITLHPEVHTLTVRASPAGMILIVAVIVVRTALRGLTIGQASSLHLPLAAVTDLFMAFAVGLMVVQRVEMFLRARRMLAQA